MDLKNLKIKFNMKRKDKSPYGNDQDSLKYWISNRNKISDLYKSEKKLFLEKWKSDVNAGTANNVCRVEQFAFGFVLKLPMHFKNCVKKQTFFGKFKIPEV